MVSSSHTEIPSSILIIGSGVFGLSTAWALCKDARFQNTHVTLLDRQPFPAQDGSSIDSSRIIRPDYADPPYTRLASIAQERWRTDFAPQHYHQTGLCITACGPEQKYVSESLANVQKLGRDEVEVLKTGDNIQRVCGLKGRDESACGSTGYVNWSSGWANAEGAMQWLRDEVKKLNKIHFKVGTAKKLLINHRTNTISGAKLDDSTEITADLTILAAGAWSPALIDLRGICMPTGQALVYMPISNSEEAALSKRPTLLNLSTGLFIITPSQGLLKIARHGHGYLNPTTIPHPESEDPNEMITVSLPYTAVDDPSQNTPMEAQREFRQFLTAVQPWLSSPSRSFTKSKICWYTDTPHGDFLIDYHPQYKGLFVATGGSGHGFKFLPVIGEKIVECVMGNTPSDFKDKWNWPKERVPEEQWPGDGSRGGPKGMILSEEMAKSRSKI